MAFTAPEGWVAITALVAVPAVKLKLLDVAAVRDAGVKVNVKAPAVPAISRSVNVATPATAATVVVPLSVPVPDATDATTFPVKPVLMLLLASVTLTTG